MLNVALLDNVKARELQADGTYHRVKPAEQGEVSIRSQVEFQNMARELAIDDPIRTTRIADPHQLFRGGDTSLF